MNVLQNTSLGMKALLAGAGALALLAIGIMILQPGPLTLGGRYEVALNVPAWEQIDATERPDLFRGGPGTLPGEHFVMGKVDGYTYRMNEDGLVVGQTRFGYANFRNLAEFETFSEKYDPAIVAAVPVTDTSM